MGDVLDEVYGVVQCKECPWYKSCTTPLRLSAEDMRRQLEQTPGMGAQPGAFGMQNLLSSMASAAQNSLVEACPVFVERLRLSPKLAQRIKDLMQNWGKDEKDK
jgi:hypothetical protein